MGSKSYTDTTQDYGTPSEHSPLLSGRNAPATPSHSSRSNGQDEDEEGEARSYQGSEEDGAHRDEKDGMNKTQVILLSLCRMADPICFFCIVPFINQMIMDTGEVMEEDVGFYSGLIVCFNATPETTPTWRAKFDLVGLLGGLPFV